MIASSSLQENVLALLCFNKEHASVISNNIEVEHFDNEIYRDIADKALQYYKKYRKPISSHLPDVFEKKLNKEKSRKTAEAYETVIKGLRVIHKEMNTEFVLKELNKFIHAQVLRMTLKKAVDLFQEGKLDAADKILNDRNSVMTEVFDPGLRFGRDMNRTMRFMHQEEELFTTGISHLDMLGVVPTRKELFMMMGLPGTGKSWGLTHVGKHNTISRATVAHVSLEMSEERCSQRYVQTYLGVAKRSQEIRNINMDIDQYGRIMEMRYDNIDGVWSFNDQSIETKIIEKLKRIYTPKLIIKQFPTGQLTMENLVAYIENLKAYASIVPDILIIDYADLMNIDTKQLRIETGRTCQQLRGLAIEYNMAVVTASQANRTGDGVTTLTRKHLAEDFSKVAISDNLVTYNQTAFERRLGLARLYVDKARNDRTGDSIIISQNYNTGQFALQSALMRGDYFDKLERYFPEELSNNEEKQLRTSRTRITRNSGKGDDDEEKKVVRRADVGRTVTYRRVERHNEKEE